MKLGIRTMGVKTIEKIISYWAGKGCLPKDFKFIISRSNKSP